MEASDFETLIACNRRVFQPISVKLGVDLYTVDLYQVKVNFKVAVVTFDLETCIACNGRVFQPILVKLGRDLYTVDLIRSTARSRSLL